MHPDQQMATVDLIKQLTTYADAITAFSMVQALAFCFAVGQGEGFAKAVLRTRGAWATTIGIVIGTFVYCFLVNRCMGAVEQLEKASGTIPLNTIASVLVKVQWTRLSLIVAGGLLSLFALWASKLDSPQR